MPHAYTEDQLVEQPAIGLCAERGQAVAELRPNVGVMLIQPQIQILRRTRALLPLRLLSGQVTLEGCNG